MTTKKLGIWMDHQSASLIEFTDDSVDKKTIESKFTSEAKNLIMNQGENQMHTKEQHQQAEYYKALGEAIKHYEAVILFGPTDAKAELFNILKADQHFAKIKIEVKQADKMTDNQQHAFVKEYFQHNSN